LTRAQTAALAFPVPSSRPAGSSRRRCVGNRIGRAPGAPTVAGLPKWPRAGKHHAHVLDRDPRAIITSAVGGAPGRRGARRL